VTDLYLSKVCLFTSIITLGQNEVQSPFQVYLGSQSDQLKDMVAILDTNSWTWRTPIPSHLNQPYPQSFATLSMVNETKLVFGYGNILFNL
jgi:hypothetical protein